LSSKTNSTSLTCILSCPFVVFALSGIGWLTGWLASTRHLMIAEHERGECALRNRSKLLLLLKQQQQQQQQQEEAWN